ncbi:DNA-formamidopyrimidine glycosylase [Metamycoplasma hominis]|uniref:DNA-formamidopyrimidine glycosylase n=1 Tax=Metamycoplasma hominis TaxID=2098 RepID=UPI000DEDBA1C|nr:DNA-formamidopyrimidine glycosylase [Metamycoplasma hominis]
MPELPEVRVVVKALNNTILNKKITNLIIYKPKIFKEFSPQYFISILRDKKIEKIDNIGKHIIFFLSEKLVLLSHLRMEGKYRYYLNPPKEIDKHLVARFVFSDNSELHFLDKRLFGTYMLRNLENYNKIPPISLLGPEPKDIDIEALFKKIKNSKMPIKTKLLDQSFVAGIGNIYADEALFASKIHPLSKACNLSLEQLKDIIKNANEIMEKSYELGGTTLFSYESLNKQEGKYQDFLNIHSDTIKKCKVCGQKTLKLKVNQRGTYVCPNCQKVY